MILFDSLIKEVNSLLDKKEKRILPISEELLEDVGKNNMVFSNEKAYELGGDKCRSLSFELPTESEELVDRDEIILLGQDISEIKEDTDFVRITLLNVQKDEADGNELYKRLETIRFTKYRVSPEGYMLRTASSGREKIRLSLSAAKESFSKIGAAYIAAYHQIPYVKHVKLIFITGKSDLFEILNELSKRKDNITDTIDHILKGMVLNDCTSCSVKELCDEVEGLRELHQKESSETVS